MRDLSVYKVHYPTGQTSWWVLVNGETFDVYPNRQKMMDFWRKRDGTCELNGIRSIVIGIDDFQWLMSNRVKHEDRRIS